jgi:hypothetical protein
MVHVNALSCASFGDLIAGEDADDEGTEFSNYISTIAASRLYLWQAATILYNMTSYFICYFVCVCALASILLH